MNTSSKNHSIEVFKKKLASYKAEIDADITSYSKYVQKTTLQEYGEYARLEVDAYLSILQRGGKRIRGALVMLGYEMSGGTDRTMIIQAARAIEMLHAYILIIDDIQDHSLTRRGGQAAHVILAEEHKRRNLSGSSDHFGLSIALDAALSGSHAAQMILSNLQAEEENVIKVLGIVNRTMLVTAHGQTNDIMNEVVADVSRQDIERVLEWKTAHYTFLNPLHVGMVLAGADCHATDAITEYAMHAGKAFQITDDILGTFGSEFESGKSPMDDVREGKRTLLTQYALENTTDTCKNFIIQILGKANLTQIEFDRYKDIIISSGGLDYAESETKRHISEAVIAIELHRDRWSVEGVNFLKGLATYLLSRNS